MNRQAIINKTKKFVKQTLEGAEGGHDWFHTKRVLANSIHIAKKENANLFVVQLAALLHDIADAKFHDGDETLGDTPLHGYFSYCCYYNCYEA